MTLALKESPLHGPGKPAAVLPPDPENARFARTARARTAMLAGHPDLDTETGNQALTLLEGTTEEPAGITVAGLLVDLAHFCDLKGYDYRQAHECARELYLEDTANEGTQFSFATATPTPVEDQEGSEDDDAYREAARGKWLEEGECEIDDGAKVSVSDDAGAYVQAWVWVSDEDAGIEREEDEE